MRETAARVRSQNAYKGALGSTQTTSVHVTTARGDLVTTKVTSATDEPIHLTPIEWRLLENLVRNEGRLVAQRQLLREVWGPAYGEETNYLRVHLTHLRHKLEPDSSRPRYLITEPGMGYRFLSHRENMEDTNVVDNTIS